MKVLQISHGIYPISQAGTEIYAANLARALVARGVTVSVAVPAWPKCREPIGPGSVPAHVVAIPLAPGHLFKNKLRYAAGDGPLWKQRLRQLIRKFDPDLVHLHHAVGFGLSLLEELERLK